MHSNEKVERILMIFKKKKYSREEPKLEKELKARISYFVRQSLPISFVGFWGVSDKDSVNEADEKSCAFLYSLGKEVKEVYPPGVDFLFVFATLHGVMNGYPIEEIKKYVSEMKILFETVGFRFMELDKLWEKYRITSEKIESLLIEKDDEWWEGVEGKEKFEKNAKRRTRRSDYKKAAKRYYIMRGLEKHMFEKEFEKSVFHAFCGKELNGVLPEMPTLYLRSRRKRSDCPWFS